MTYTCSTLWKQALILKHVQSIFTVIIIIIIKALVVYFDGLTARKIPIYSYEYKIIYITFLPTRSNRLIDFLRASKSQQYHQSTWIFILKWYLLQCISLNTF